MRVLFAGFNLFKQISNKDDLLVDAFTEYTRLPGADVELGHTYLIVNTAEGIYFYSGDRQPQVITMNFMVVQVCCTDTKIIFLTDEGLMYKANLGNIDVVENIPNFIMDSNDGDDKSKDRIIKISCSSYLNVVLTKQGQLYSSFTKLKTPLTTITSFCTGIEHCLLLDNLGNVYSFGRGSRGQLGHGLLDDEASPKLIEALCGIRIQLIAAGGWHSCAISATNDLYSWGWNSNGQLGTQPEKVVATPRVVDFDGPEGEQMEANVIKIACGNRHTIALLDSCKLYGTGWNKYQQLGIKSEENVNSMTFIQDFSNCNIVQLKCGPWSSAVVLET